MTMSTWPKDITPIVHYSESKGEHQLDESIKPQGQISGHNKSTS